MALCLWSARRDGSSTSQRQFLSTWDSHRWDRLITHTHTHTHAHAHTHTHTRISLCIQVHLHTCAYLLLTLSYPLPWVCVCVCVNIFDCTLRAHLWSATLTGAMLLSLSLYVSLPPSLSLQVLTSVDCLWPLVLWMLSPAILPRCINNNSNYWPSNQSVAPARWACLGEQIDRHLKSHIDCREGEKHQGGWEDR